MVPGGTLPDFFVDGRGCDSFNFHLAVRDRRASRESAGKMKYCWSLAPTQPLLAGRLVSSLNLSPLLAQCLLNRGLSDAPAIQNFLEPRLKNLSDPFLLPDMEKAVGRLFRAREQ